MISRIWHGWTDPANADAYEEMLRSVALPGIEPGARKLLSRFDERVSHNETVLAPD